MCADSNIIDVEFEEVDDPQEVAGDPFAELEYSECPLDPHGHLWFAPKCGMVPRCVHCKEAAPWR